MDDNNGNSLSVTGFWFYDLEEHIALVPFSAEDNCDKGDLDIGHSAPGLVKAELENRLTELHSAMASFAGTVDGGRNEELRTAIGDPVTWPSHALRGLLLASAPLSDEVIAEAIRRELPMDPWHLTQVLIDNSPLSKDVQSVLDESEALDPFFLDLLTQYEEGYSSRDLLEQEMGRLHAEKSGIHRRLVQALAADSTMHTRDTLAMVVTLDSTPWSLRLAHQLQFFGGAYQAAHTLAAALQQEEANAGLLAFAELWEQMNAPDSNTAQAPPVDELEALAFAPDAHSGMAAAWAALIGLQATDSLPQGWLPAPYRMALPTPARRTRSTQAPALRSTPNPARERVMLTYPEWASYGSVEVFDAQGRLIRSIALQGRPAFVELELAGWSKGLYLARLLVEGQQAGETKFQVIQ